MADGLEDTQSERDRRDIAIHRVGVRGLRHPITVRNAIGGESQSTVASVSMSVYLPPEQRGTHMSRFVSILQEKGAVISVDTFPTFAKEILGGLHASEATVSFAFPLFVTKAAPVTGSTGMVDYEVELKADIGPLGTMTSLTVAVPVTTLCPCSRNISERGAHNQRGVVRISVVGEKNLPSVRTLIERAEACGSAALYSVLKRPDEKHVTELAYDNPVFVEDLVRNVALSLDKLEGVDGYEIEAENLESIHNHSAFAIVRRGAKP